MADSKKTSITSWQRQKAEDFVEPEEASAETDTPMPPPASEPEAQLELLDLAKEWLEHDNIRDAPTDKKISFLEKKGLSNDSIQTVLGVSRNPDASSSSSSEPKPTPSEPNAQQPTPSSTIVTSSASNPPPSTTETSPPSQTTAQKQDTPPIITYPEFLLHANRPAPLVTRQRLLTTLYTTALIGAAVHTTSTYLVEPMVASLNSARHTLFGTVHENLTSLNEKLGEVVSQIPDGAKHPHLHADDDTSSIASDPTELFHRDAGVQTSSPPSPSPGDPFPATTSKSKVADHVDKAAALEARLSTLNDSFTYTDEKVQVQRDELQELQMYLEDLRFGQNRPGKWDQRLGHWVGNPDDEITRVKAEIKGVKGVLLSARSFPGANGVVGR